MILKAMGIVVNHQCDTNVDASCPNHRAQAKQDEHVRALNHRALSMGAGCPDDTQSGGTPPTTLGLASSTQPPIISVPPSDRSHLHFCNDLLSKIGDFDLGQYVSFEEKVMSHPLGRVAGLSCRLCPTLYPQLPGKHHGGNEPGPLAASSCGYVITLGLRATPACPRKRATASFSLFPLNRLRFECDASCQNQSERTG